MFRLIVRRTGSAPVPYPLEANTVVIGRCARSSVPLEHGLVSRKHCTLTRVSRRAWQVVDHSRHGTYLDHARLPPAEPTALPVGSLLGIGPFQVELTESRYRTRAITDPFIPFHDVPAQRDPPPIVLGDLAGRGPLMERVVQDLRLFAPSPHAVLVRGETGTGKELAARALHDHSGRPGEFIAINAAGLVDTLLATTLFGQVRGAFTGATETRDGAFHAAHRGTLFLDEIGDLTPSAQISLLRCLETGEIVRVGDVRSERPDVRVVAATHQDLEALCASGRFRTDLLARLTSLTLTLPPLRARREDIPDLVHTLLQREHPGARISAAAIDALRDRDYPQNVRQLRNLLCAAATRSQGDIHVSHLDLPEASPPPAHADPNVAEAVRLYDVTRSLRAAARVLGLDHKTVARLIDRTGRTDHRRNR